MTRAALALGLVALLAGGCETAPPQERPVTPEQLARALTVIDPKSVQAEFYYRSLDSEENMIARPPGSVEFGIHCLVEQPDDIAALAAIVSGMKVFDSEPQGNEFSLEVVFKRRGERIFTVVFAGTGPTLRDVRGALYAKGIVRNGIGEFDSDTVRKLGRFVNARFFDPGAPNAKACTPPEL